jgi:uncharacterized membrane protein
MGFQFNGQTVDLSTTIDTNLETPSTSQTTKVGTAASNGATAVTVHTVTAGKTFYYHYAMVSNGDSTAFEVHVLDTDGSTPIAKVVCNGKAAVKIDLQGKSFGAGVAIKMVSTAGASTSLFYVVVGHEE